MTEGIKLSGLPCSCSSEWGRFQVPAMTFLSEICGVHGPSHFSRAVRRTAILLATLGFVECRAEDMKCSTSTIRKNLAHLVRSDPGAAKLFLRIEQQAKGALAAPGSPVELIGTAGKLQSDAAKVQSRAALQDMPKLASLAYTYAVTTNTQYSAAAKRIILAWARINQPTGLPVDETKLDTLFTAYGLTRHVFSAEEREVTD